MVFRLLLDYSDGVCPTAWPFGLSGCLAKQPESGAISARAAVCRNCRLCGNGQQHFDKSSLKKF